jgi:hypothetical protein
MVLGAQGSLDSVRICNYQCAITRTHDPVEDLVPNRYHILTSSPPSRAKAEIL